MTVTTAANAIPTIYNTEAGDAVKANIVIGAQCDHQFDSQLKMGNAIRIADWTHPSVRVKSADTAGTYANRTETSQTITVNRQAYVAMNVEDIAELQSQTSLRKKYMMDAGYSLAAYVDGDATSGIVSLINGFTNSVGTLGTDPSDDDLIRAVQYLDDYNVPEDGRWFGTSPGIHASLLKLNKFTSSDFVSQADAATAVQRAKVGMVYGAPVYKTSLFKNNPNVAGQAYGYFGHQKGMVLIMQQTARTDQLRDILNIADAFTVYVIYQFASRLVPPATLGGGTSLDYFNVAVAGS